MDSSTDLTYSNYLIDGYKNSEEKIKELTEKLDKERLKHQYLEKQIEQLTQFNKELKYNANIVAHELRAPLSVISNYIQVLNKKYKDKLDNDGQNILKIAMDHIDMISRMMNSIREYSQTLKADTFEDVNLNEIINLINQQFSPMLSDGSAEIKSAQLPVVKANKLQMYQLFINLIGNSLKFRNNLPPVIKIEAQEKDKEWIISVKDNGIGISKDYHNDIFILFKRLDEAAYIGEGIGLAVCKGIIENHQGRIWVESEPGKGANFFFTIPFK